jgi:hypothetical protein
VDLIETLSPTLSFISSALRFVTTLDEIFTDAHNNMCHHASKVQFDSFPFETIPSG